MEAAAETTLFLLMIGRPPRSPLFPSPPLFRSHVGEPTKLPGPLVILAVAEPLPTVVPTAVTVMVSGSLELTAVVAVPGVIAILALTHVLLAGALLPAVPSVVRVTEPSPVSGMEEVAETTVVPVLAEVITTVQLAVAPAPV